MVQTLAIVLFLTLNSPRNPATPSVWTRFPELDRLAEIIQNSGAIPAGGEMLLFSAAAGWPALTSSVYLFSGNTGIEEALEALGASEPMGYGLHPGHPGTTNVVVTARVPGMLPALESHFVATGERVEMLIPGCGEAGGLTVLATTPDLSTLGLEADSSGTVALIPENGGVYWLEVLRNSPTGPAVELLFPLVADHSSREVLDGSLRPLSSSAEIACGRSMT